MKVPNAENAIIPVEKLRDYLLSRSHPEGRSKAMTFATLGYTEADWTLLERDLRAQHLSLEADPAPITQYGRKFVIVGPLRGPSAALDMKSIWIVRAGEDVPRFVTAYRAENA